MHADIEKYTVDCVRDYQKCITIVMEQSGRKLVTKKCANDSICRKDIGRCDGSVRSTGGGRKTERLCTAWCCKDYMCNNASLLSPAHLVMVLAFKFVALV